MRKLNSNEIKQIEFELLKAFKAMCEANGLYYTLCGGTLLGAIRHQGFIPWDDDIDVLMPRPDYDRLLEGKNINTAMFPDFYSIVNWRNNTHDYPFIKMVDTRTLIEIPYLNHSFKPKSLWIDIFPIDGNPDDEQSLRKLYKKALFCRQLIRLKTANPKEGKSRLKKALKPLLVSGVKLLNNSRLCEELNQISKSYSFIEQSKIGGVLWGYGPQERIDKQQYLTPVDVSFEGEMFNAPSNYDEYLTGLYGDYMKLPPENRRITHEMVAYIQEIE